jgi:Protein of unknown function (DUF2934)
MREVLGARVRTEGIETWAQQFGRFWFGCFEHGIPVNWHARSCSEVRCAQEIRNCVANCTPEPMLEQAIRQRAYELYIERGRVPGHALEDWLQAEAELVLGHSTSDSN